MNVTAGDRPATLVPADFPTNRGGLCSKGWSSTELLDHPERLLRPLVRATPGDRTSPLVETTWDDALGRLVDAIRRTQARHGRDAVGCFGGGSLTNEQAYQFGKFARVALRTSAIDYNGRFCMSSAAGAANRAFGLDRGMPFPLSDIAEADVVVLVGSNPADTMPPAMQYFDEGRARGRPARRRRPAAHRRPPATPPCTCSRCPAPTWRWPTGCCTSRWPRAWSTRSTSPRGPPGSRRCGRASPRTGPTGWSG